MFLSGGLFFLFAILVFFLIPAEVTGAEEADGEKQVPFSLKNVVLVLILNKMPPVCGIILAESVLAACMSCADTHLNCAAANLVSDILDPNGKLDGPTSVRYAKLATLLAGIVAIVSGLYGSFIYALGTYGYTICGGVLIPAFVIGLVCRDRKSEVFRSRMSVTAAKIGMTAGVVTAVAFENYRSCIPPLFLSPCRIRAREAIGAEIYINRFMEESEFICSYKSICNREISKIYYTCPVIIP